MTKTKRKFDLIPDERRQQIVKDIIAFFKDERNEEIGIVAAESILDFFLQTIGEDIYNMAIADSKKLLKQNFENLEVDLDILINK